MKIAFIIILVIVIALVSLIVIDRIIMSQELKAISNGMTGKEIQENSGLKLRVVKVNSISGEYEAILYSKMKLFKYSLKFKNGKLESRKRI